MNLFYMSLWEKFSFNFCFLVDMGYKESLVIYQLVSVFETEGDLCYWSLLFCIVFNALCINLVIFGEPECLVRHDQRAKIKSEYQYEK